MSCVVLLSSLFEVTLELLFNKLFDTSLNNKRTTVALKRSQHKTKVKKLLESREFHNQINNVTTDIQQYKMNYFFLAMFVKKVRSNNKTAAVETVYFFFIERNH